MSRERGRVGGELGSNEISVSESDREEERQGETVKSVRAAEGGREDETITSMTVRTTETESDKRRR